MTAIVAVRIRAEAARSRSATSRGIPPIRNPRSRWRRRISRRRSRSSAPRPTFWRRSRWTKRSSARIRTASPFPTRRRSRSHARFAEDVCRDVLRSEQRHAGHRRRLRSGRDARRGARDIRIVEARSAAARAEARPSRCATSGRSTSSIVPAPCSRRSSSARPRRRAARADYIPLRTTNMIYGGAFYSRLTRNIRESKGYTYSPFSSADLRRAAGTLHRRRLGAQRGHRTDDPGNALRARSHARRAGDGRGAAVGEDLQHRRDGAGAGVAGQPGRPHQHDLHRRAVARFPADVPRQGRRAHAGRGAARRGESTSTRIAAPSSSSAITSRSRIRSRRSGM